MSALSPSDFSAQGNRDADDVGRESEGGEVLSFQEYISSIQQHHLEIVLQLSGDIRLDWEVEIQKTQGVSFAWNSVLPFSQIAPVHGEWARAHAVSLPNEMVDFPTKTLTMGPLLLKNEESSKELCDEHVGLVLPRPCLEPNVSMSVVREDVPHFLKGQQRKSEGEFI